jgi:hypothetical protein
MAKKIELDSETADGITVLVIKEHLSFAKKNIKELKEEMSKGSLSQNKKLDLVSNLELESHFNAVLKYFGKDRD